MAYMFLIFLQYCWNRFPSWLLSQCKNYSVNLLVLLYIVSNVMHLVIVEVILIRKLYLYGILVTLTKGSLVVPFWSDSCTIHFCK